MLPTRSQLKMRALVVWIYALLQLSAAEDINCTVTQYAAMTTYTIPDFKQTDCEYSWSNSSNYPLATHMNKHDDLVESKNETHLTTKACMWEIKYRRDCLSEKVVRELICKTNCNGATDLSKSTEIYPLHIVVPVAVLLLLVVIIGGCIAYHKITYRKLQVDNPDPSPFLSGFRNHP